jgi:biopolymer transport protein ExbD
MKLKFLQQAEIGFDLTPFVDVIFLLIIFFMLVCQFFADEVFEVLLPDKIASVQDSATRAMVTITVMQKDGKVSYAAGSDILPGEEPALLERMVASAIDSRETQAGQDKIVCLRCDKQVAFAQVRPVLHGIAKSSAQKVQWATIKE